MFNMSTNSSASPLVSPNYSFSPQWLMCSSLLSHDFQISFHHGQKTCCDLCWWSAHDLDGKNISQKHRPRKVVMNEGSDFQPFSSRGTQSFLSVLHSISFFAIEKALFCWHHIVLLVWNHTPNDPANKLPTSKLPQHTTGQFTPVNYWLKNPCLRVGGPQTWILIFCTLGKTKIQRCFFRINKMQRNTGWTQITIEQGTISHGVREIM